MIVPAGFSGVQKVFVLSKDPELRKQLTRLWPENELEFTFFEQGRGAVEFLFNEPPDLLIVDNKLEDIKAVDVASLVKSENVYRQLPVIVCLDSEDLNPHWDFTSVEIDDFIVRPFVPDIVRARVDLTLCRALRALDANPLSKLPGNTSIIQRIQELIDRKQDFALAYCDLDYFKSFNDKYGFSRGDEILMMTARIIVNIIRGLPGTSNFVGHVGGDDFVFITPIELVERACQGIVDNFDAIVPHFYDEDDKKQGHIRSTDRQGEVRTFPLMAISIAVVVNKDGRLGHYGEASSIAMSLKKKAKENPKSCYVIDQREK